MKPPSPFKLQVVPFPAGRSETSDEMRRPLPDGFVDEDVIASFISQPGATRIASAPSDLVLSSDENDFAGWSIHGVSPFRVIAEKQERVTARPLPEQSEPGLGEPHRGNHRWWIAAATSIASAFIFSLLFTTLADRPGMDGGLFSSISKQFGELQSALGSLAP